MSALSFHRGSPRRIVAAMIVALLVVIVGCVALVLATAASTPPLAVFNSPVATITTGPLTWLVTQAPGDLYYDILGEQVAIAPSASSTAYVCTHDPAGSTGIADIWLTTDRGKKWDETSTLTPHESITTCGVTVDQTQPSTIVAQTWHEVHDGCMDCGDGDYRMNVSQDDGKTWAALHGPFDILSDLATLGDATYALFAPHPVDLQMLKTEFAISTDGMRTWKALDASFVAGGRYVTAFWVNPTTSSILVEVGDGGFSTDEFYASMDGGQSWHSLRLPNQGEYFVQPSSPTQTAWHICIEVLLPTSQTNLSPYPARVTCTLDGGRTWTKVSDDANDLIFAMTNSGALLRAAPASVDQVGTTPTVLQRLAIGTSDTWVKVAPLQPPLPSNSPMYIGGAGQGMLWMLPQAGMSGAAARTIYTTPFP